MRGSPGPAGRTQVWPDKHVLVFRLWEEAGERFSHPGKPMIQRRGKDLEQRALAPLRFPGRGPHHVQSQLCIGSGVFAV